MLYFFYKIRQTLSSQIKVKRSKFIQGKKWRKKADVRLMRAVLRYNARGLTSQIARFYLSYFINVDRKRINCMCVLYDMRELASRLANPFGHTSHASPRVRKFNSGYSCKLASTCNDLRVCLARA